MADSVTELVVFLASPSDLEDEREAVRSVVDETNSLLANLDLRFRVAGWENTLPDAGRPQGLINPDVERCDIFVGLLKHRWGSPTGLYSSGFEEEYALAQARHDQGGLPSMHLFFGDVPASLLEDPGASLQQVLAFKEKVSAERQGLYRTFQDPHDLVRQVQSVLMAKALAHSAAAAKGAAAGSSAAEEPTSDGIVSEELDAAREQMSAALQALAAIVRGETTPVGDKYDADRLELIARAFGKDKEQFGAHLANRLFRRRKDFVLSVGEADLWLETLLGDIGRHPRPDRTIPGWGALTSLPAAIGDVVRMATSSERSVAVGAIRAMREHDVRPAELFGGLNGDSQASDDLEKRVDTWVEILNANSGKSEALDFLLASFGASGRLTQGIAAAGQLSLETAQLLANAHSANGGDPQQLASDFDVIYARRSDNVELRRILASQLQALPDEGLLLLLRRAGGSDILVPAMAVALTRGLIGPQEVEKLVKWDNLDHVDLLLEAAKSDPATAEALLAGGKRPESRRFRAALAASAIPVEELRATYRAKPWDTDAWEAVLIVGESEEVVEARDLLDHQGSKLREELNQHLSEREDLIDFVVREKSAAAAIFLARNLEKTSSANDAEDRKCDLMRVTEAARSGPRHERIQFVRELATRVRLELAADVAVIKPWLEAMADDMYASEWGSVMETALAPLAAEIAGSLNDESLRDRALIWLAAQPTTKDEELLDHIYSDQSEVRMTAIGNLIGRWERAPLVKLLGDYAGSQRPYWYNVIAALDDYLYAGASE